MIHYERSSSADSGCGLCGCIALLAFFLLPLMLLGRVFGGPRMRPRRRHGDPWRGQRNTPPPPPPPEPPPAAGDIIDVEAHEVPPELKQIDRE